MTVDFAASHVGFVLAAVGLYGVLAVVRVLDALTVSQPMVGGPLNLVRITPDGAHHLEDDEIEAVREARDVGRNRLLELRHVALHGCVQVGR